MPLPAPKLDDRSLQDIIDEAKRRVHMRCPEWSDHNVSDPGMTLIKLFAQMTHMVLDRVNQVPDKIYITFLDMLGVRLAPARSARTWITFYLSAALPADLTIPAGTQVATLRTEAAPAIIFST